MTTSTSPSAIFAAEPAARPRSAPQPERVGVALCEPKPQPVVEDFTEERDGERGHGRVRTIRFPLLDWGLREVQFSRGNDTQRDASTDASRRFHHARTDRHFAATRACQRLRRLARFY